MFTTLEPVYGEGSLSDEAYVRFDRLKSKFSELYGCQPDLFARAPGTSTTVIVVIFAIIIVVVIVVILCLVLLVREFGRSVLFVLFLSLRGCCLIDPLFVAGRSVLLRGDRTSSCFRVLQVFFSKFRILDFISLSLVEALPISAFVIVLLLYIMS